MEIKIMLLFLNCITIYFVCQLVDAKRDESDKYRFNLRRTTKVNSEDKGPCTSEEDCNFQGSCEGNLGEKYCDCYPGISGRSCEIIDECVDNPGMCGNDPDAVCRYQVNKGKAFCKCKSFNKRFDVPTKTCIDQKPCETHKDCFNGAICRNKYSRLDKRNPKYCQCKFGTTGDYCERVEECIDNPNYCGNDAGVECRYNSYLERAYCQCMNPNQRFDWPLKKCVDRKKCRTNEDCLPFGACTDRCSSWEACLDYQHIEEKRSCHCIEGTSGENCELIDDCHNKIVDCGTSDNVTCDYYYNQGLTAFAYCRCKDRSMEFDHLDKQCKVCDCGSGAAYCHFRDGVKTCVCSYGSYNHGDRCEECKCGEGSKGCTFNNGEKICICKPGYKNNNGICELE